MLFPRFFKTYSSFIGCKFLLKIFWVKTHNSLWSLHFKTVSEEIGYIKSIYIVPGLFKKLPLDKIQCAPLIITGIILAFVFFAIWNGPFLKSNKTYLLFSEIDGFLLRVPSGAITILLPDLSLLHAISRASFAFSILFL